MELQGTKYNAPKLASMGNGSELSLPGYFNKFANVSSYTQAFESFEQMLSPLERNFRKFENANSWSDVVFGGLGSILGLGSVISALVGLFK